MITRSQLNEAFKKLPSPRLTTDDVLLIPVSLLPSTPPAIMDSHGPVPDVAIQCIKFRKQWWKYEGKGIDDPPFSYQRWVFLGEVCEDDITDRTELEESKAAWRDGRSVI